MAGGNTITSDLGTRKVADAEIKKDGAQRVVHVPGPAQADQKHSNARLPRRLLVGPLSAQPWPAAAGAILLGTGLAPVERQRHPHLDDRPATAVAAGPGHVHHRPPRPRPAAAPAGAVAAIVPFPPL